MRNILTTSLIAIISFTVNAQKKKKPIIEEATEAIEVATDDIEEAKVVDYYEADEDPIDTLRISAGRKSVFLIDVDENSHGAQVFGDN